MFVSGRVRNYYEFWLSYYRILLYYWNKRLFDKTKPTDQDVEEILAYYGISLFEANVFATKIQSGISTVCIIHHNTFYVI